MSHSAAEALGIAIIGAFVIYQYSPILFAALISVALIVLLVFIYRKLKDLRERDKYEEEHPEARICRLREQRETRHKNLISFLIAIIIIGGFVTFVIVRLIEIIEHLNS